MTGTSVIKPDYNLAKLKQAITERLSPNELNSLDNILNSKDSLEEFTNDYCSALPAKHNSFSQENIYLICDKLK